MIVLFVTEFSERKRPLLVCFLADEGPMEKKHKRSIAIDVWVWLSLWVSLCVCLVGTCACLETISHAGMVVQNHHSIMPVNKGAQKIDVGNQKVHSALPHTTMTEGDIPEEWNWADMKGLSFITRVGNQMQPRGCGSCWAFSTSGSVSDRLKIGRYRATGKMPTDINLSVQALLDCGAANHSIGGCHGGSAQNAFSFMYDHGIPDETCAPYVASAPGWWAEDDCWKTLCRTCDVHGNCYVTNDGTMYKVEEYGLILPAEELEEERDGGNDMVYRMQAEIMQRGPIVCGM